MANKEETFESLLTDEKNFWYKQGKAMLKILDELKQLHDTEIKNRTFTLSETIKEKDKEIENLKFNLKIEKGAHEETAKDLTYQISELQAENEKLKTTIDKLTDEIR